MIEAQSLTRRHGAVTAVNRVSFHIESRGIVGLLGNSGAGKTTLMQMLSGYLEPTAGQLSVTGRDEIHGGSTTGYLPQGLSPYPDMTVAGFLDFMAACKRIAPALRTMAMHEALLSTHLNDWALAPIRSLDPCPRQRVGIAQALLGAPRLLLLDAPGAGLDPEETHRLHQLIRRLGRRATVIFTTSSVEEADTLCDRVLILDKGRLVADTPRGNRAGDLAAQYRAALGGESGA